MGLRQSTGWTIGVAGWRNVYGYDPAQRLTAMRQRFDGAASITAYANTARFYYNPAGQIKSRTISNDVYAETSHYDVARDYTVNGLNQYTGTSSGGTPSAAFTYDELFVSYRCAV